MQSGGEQEHLDDRFQVRTTAESHFSWVRTRLSVERTMMSWIRTAVALIGFGFTIVQFFERLQDMENVTAALRPQAPRYLGLALIGSGVIVLLISLWQYARVVRYLWHEPFRELAGMFTRRMKPVAEQTPVFTVTIVLLAIGLFAFFSVLFRAF
jgi:putative membrane protein